ncbi:MAG: hypothetical protein WAU96_10860 [Anaerolineae bacterium]|nr:hypothetical protein [Thermoflexales bacterium]
MTAPDMLAALKAEIKVHRDAITRLSRLAATLEGQIQATATSVISPQGEASTATRGEGVKS